MMMTIHDLGGFVLLSPVNVKGRTKGNNFYFYPICISNQKILLQLLSCQANWPRQAVAPLSTGSRLLWLHFLRKQLTIFQNLYSSSLLRIGLTIVVEPMEGMISVEAPLPKSSNLTFPPPSVARSHPPLPALSSCHCWYFVTDAAFVCCCCCCCCLSLVVVCRWSLFVVGRCLLLFSTRICRNLSWESRNFA